MCDVGTINRGTWGAGVKARRPGRGHHKYRGDRDNLRVTKGILDTKNSSELSPKNKGSMGF